METKQLTLWHVHIAMPDFNGAGCMTIGTVGSEDSEATRNEALALAKRELALCSKFSNEQRVAASISKFEIDPQPIEVVQLMEAMGIITLLTDETVTAHEVAAQSAKTAGGLRALPVPISPLTFH